MKKVLILGAQGNLGGQLVKVFSGAYKVIAWDKAEVDITKREMVLSKIKEAKPDIIVNAAAYNAVDQCEQDNQEFVLAKKLNGEAVGYLAEAALKDRAVLVHYSSDYVFGGDTKETNNRRIERIKKQGGYKEDDQPNPVNKYAETKLMGEREIIKSSRQGLKWYLIRTSKLFGPKGASGLTKPSFFDIMLKLAKEKTELDLVDEEISCFTYTSDLARATKQLFEEQKPYGIYHLINPGPATWFAAAQELFRQAGIKIKLNPVSSAKFPRPAERPEYSVLLNTKLEPLRGWREALREYLREKFRS